MLAQWVMQKTGAQAMVVPSAWVPRFVSLGWRCLEQREGLMDAPNGEPISLQDLEGLRLLSSASPAPAQRVEPVRRRKTKRRASLTSSRKKAGG